jgi:hypothetical protein
MDPTELQVALVEPEPWALRAAGIICEEHSKIMADRGYPSRGGEFRDRSVRTCAKLIQYIHDAALPKDRN